MKFLLVCLLAAEAVLADYKVLDINNEVDKAFVKLNSIAPSINKLPIGFEIGGFNVSDGYTIGLNSIKRTGNCSLTEKTDLSEVTVDLYYGLGFGHLLFGKVVEEGVAAPFTGIFRIKDISIHSSITSCNTTDGGCFVKINALEYDTFEDVEVLSHCENYNTTDGGCYVKINALEYETFEDVKVSASLPALDGQDASDFFRTEVKPFLNKQLADLKSPLEEKFSQMACKVSDFNRHIADDIYQLFTNLIEL